MVHSILYLKKSKFSKDFLKTCGDFNKAKILRLLGIYVNECFTDALFNCFFKNALYRFKILLFVEINVKV
jgi:hypothetical protein